MISDLLVVSLAWCVAYWFRFESGYFPIDKGKPKITEYLSVLALIALVWGPTLRWMGLYKPMRGVREVRERLQLISANTISVVILIALVYLLLEKNVPFSRAVFLCFWFFAVVFTLIERSFLRFLLRDLRRKGHNLRYLLIIGIGKVAADLVIRLRNRRELGIQIVGCLSVSGNRDEGPHDVPVIGKYQDVHEVIKRLPVDQVIIALPLNENHLLPTVIEQLGDSTVDVKIVPDVHQFISLTGSIEEFEGLPVIGLQVSPIVGISLILKRVFDMVVSAILLVILSPLMLLIAILVKISSKGPAIYSQERVSLDGSIFQILKFRTMCCDAESNGPGWTKSGDSRVTKLGKFLRSTSLDELPQIINVLKGEMSIVGPRPERPVYITEFRRHIPRYMLRHKVPAGMTGWAQVNGWRGDTAIEKRIECDLYYIENWSFFLDIKIILLTFIRGFRNQNAY
jgi:Undecaprenyl-phosphate glucose phosphotransferase